MWLRKAASVKTRESKRIYDVCTRDARFSCINGCRYQSTCHLRHLATSPIARRPRCRRGLARCSHREVSYEQSTALLRSVGYPIHSRKKERRTRARTDNLTDYTRPAYLLVSLDDNCDGNAIVWTPVIFPIVKETACLRLFARSDTEETHGAFFLPSRATRSRLPLLLLIVMIETLSRFAL